MILVIIALLVLVLVLANAEARAWLAWLVTAAVMVAIPLIVLAGLGFLLLIVLT